METLFNGKPIKVKKIDGSEEEVQVRQLPLKEYRNAFAKSDDEFEVTAIIVGKTITWVMDLDPDSYEILRTACSVVNCNGFFAYCGRRQRETMEQINLLSPELAKAVKEKASSYGLPPSVPRPV